MKRVTVADVVAELRAINANLARAEFWARGGQPRRPKRRQYVPPRAPASAEQLEECFAPAPSPPLACEPTSVLVELPMHPPAPLPSSITAAAAVASLRAAEAAAVSAQRDVINAKATWRGPCKAVCANSGKACGLLAGHAGDHRSARGPFRLAAAPGQTHFAAREALDRAAVASADSPRMTDVRGAAADKREERRRAHAGDVTADDKSVASAVARGTTS